MDNIAIETLAVNFVKDKLVLCNHLTPFISDNDKEPSWDGFIYIYNTNKKSKDDIFGRVPVQVKGKLVKKKDFAKKQITYSVKTADLRNYLNEGGTLFLVVYLSENGENKKIYYSELTPIRIRKILDVSPSAKSRSIIFKELPDDNNKIEQLAYEFQIALADTTCDIIDTICSEQYISQVALSGGLMYNRILVGRIMGTLEEMGYKVSAIDTSVNSVLRFIQTIRFPALMRDLHLDRFIKEPLEFQRSKLWDYLRKKTKSWRRW